MEQLESAEQVQRIRGQVAAAAERVARLGGWGDRDAAQILLARLPTLDEDGNTVPGSGGFDAGIACALDLIPREKQQLAAELHAAYTPRSVVQVRHESRELDPDSETCWWLAACSVCEEGPGDVTRLLGQVERFGQLAGDPELRVAAAREEFRRMRDGFRVDEAGFAQAHRDGGMQGAYLAGHEVAGMYAPAYGLYFLGTFHPSLGLEGFPWKEPGRADAEVLAERQGRSGPVGGSPQFVKCADQDEYLAARAQALRHLER